MTTSLRLTFVALLLTLGGVFFAKQTPQAHAAASMSVSAPSSVEVGQEFNLTVNVNTGGEGANSYSANLGYSTGFFEGVRGNYTGGVCTLQITSPEPNGGVSEITCGSPTAFSGSGLVATIRLKATTAGSTTLNLSGCEVLAADGTGRNLGSGCSDKSITITEPVKATPTPSPTPKPTSTPRPTTAATKAPDKKAAETPKAAESTPEPTAPPVQALPAETPTPVPAVTATETPGAGGSSSSESADDTASNDEKRSIGQAISDAVKALTSIGQLGGEATSLIAVLVLTIPALALAFGIIFLAYRLFVLGKRRKRTMDRLFEMELAELAALEAKMDLLSEKGTKGREQYREEFRLAKEKILRELKPDYAKPVDPPAKGDATTAAPLSTS